ncbi:DUF3488 and transglutaminase-like domain-containing protein [Acetatifactor muris]|uniref:Protein-glutamine gamma-glutamyltransferase n=1 Tax=Acetatifactor muris TaxID=879566 RepID=A0A2K4ZA54_9FIRM|nr:transglutaminase domain-containing protein [Acetatifactor muris]MCR2047449.1 DUF3488 and transglutaminase-like domain-containing protein [Acetatifactor muris]SOY27344.1 Protein-glutamine gamma-glutamyltransferase [Acetatifactor muris]
MKEKLGFDAGKVYRVVNIGLLMCMGLIGREQFRSGERPGIRILAAVLIFGISAGLIFMRTRGRILCLGAVGVCLGTTMAFAGRTESLVFLRSFFPWLWGNSVEFAEWEMGYELMLGTGMAVLCFLTELLFERFPALKIGLSGLLLTGLLYCLFNRNRVIRPAVVFILGYLLMTYVEWTQRHWEKVCGRGRKAHMLWIMPFILLYTVLTLCMPAPEKPYEWPLVRAVYHQIRENFRAFTQSIRWGNGEGFDMAFSGFSEDGEVGGNLQEASREVMTVQMDRGQNANLYLTGKVYDTFDGRQWEQRYQGDQDSVFLDTAETLCAVRKYNARYRGDYMYEINASINYRYFHTGFVFAPVKVWRIEGGRRFAYSCNDGTLLLKRGGGYGTEYRVQYYRMNLGQEEFWHFVEEQSADRAVMSSGEMDEAISNELWTRIGREEKEPPVSPEEVARYRQGITERYLGEVVLSREASAYVAEITGEAGTMLEKLKAIEKELSGWIYTKSPGLLPESVKDQESFLDYFLLESRQGYCTYFATAFVLLARAHGIPARFVQGYCVPAQGTGEINVYSDMAHAWPEVYIAGVGWIPFEPTPGYGGLRYTSWGLNQPDEDAAEAGNQPYIEMPEFGAPAMEEMPEMPEMEDVTDVEDTGETGYLQRMLRVALPVIVLLCVLSVLLENALGRYRYGRMSPDGKFREEIRRNLRILSALGLERGQWETLQEMRERGTGRRDLTVDRDMREVLRFIEDYEDVVYGARPVTEDMIWEAVKKRQILVELLKRERRLAYYYYRMRMVLMRYR